MHYERTKETHKKILAMCKKPVSQAIIAKKLGYTSQRAHYHVMRMVDRGELIMIFEGKAVPEERYKYVVNKSANTPLIPKPIKQLEVEPDDEQIILEKSTEIDALSAKEALREKLAKADYDKNSAMAKVENLAKKLQLQSEKMRAERKSSRTYVGISQVYNG